MKKVGGEKTLKPQKGNPVTRTDNNAVTLIVPWITSGHECKQTMVRGVRTNPDKFITERSRVHEVYIREQEKTKRLSLIISAILFISSCGFYVFAPEDRQSLANWIGAAMLVLSAGAAGYKRLWAKGKDLRIKADQGVGE
jgi:hypothetical protein